MEPNKMNIYQKLVLVRQEVVYVKQEAKGYNFSYASGKDIIGAVRKKMDELNLLLVPNTESFEFVDFPKGSATIRIPKICISYTWINADNPAEQIVTRATYFEDKMTGCQAIGAIETYAERYFLQKFFQIATGKDDIEAFYEKNGFSAKLEDDKSEKAEPKEEKELISDEQIAMASLCFSEMLGDMEMSMRISEWLKAVRDYCSKSGAKMSPLLKQWEQDRVLLETAFSSYELKQKKALEKMSRSK